MSVKNQEERPTTSTGERISVPRRYTLDKDESKKHMIAVTQMTATNNKEDNLKTCSELIVTAKKLNCQMVFLPEACDYIGECKEETLSLAETLDGPTIKAFSKMAKDNDIWISVGGFHEKASSEKIRNCHLVINSEGIIIAVYRKVHLFDINIPEKNVRLMESEYVIPGNEIIPPIDTPVGRVGMLICYDMRFPEMSMSLSKMNADILTYPSAFTYATGSEHWESLLRARAIENQCFVVAAAQTGYHNKNRNSWGHAMIVDPTGAKIAECMQGTRLAVAEVDLNIIEEVKGAFPLWSNRRQDLYGELVVKKKTLPASEYSFCGTQIEMERIILKTERSLAFMSCNPVVPGHIIVIPLRQVSRVTDLTTKEGNDLFELVKKVQDVLEKSSPISASTLYTKEGSEHLRVHLIPRSENDFPSIDDVYTYLKAHVESSDKIAKSISAVYTKEEICNKAAELRSQLFE